jgi:hypothetical protein
MEAHTWFLIAFVVAIIAGFVYKKHVDGEL